MFFIFIMSLLVGLILGWLVYRYFMRRASQKPSKSEDGIVRGGACSPEDIAKAIGASSSNTKGIYGMAFQGGKFVLNFMMPEAHVVSVLYPNFCQYKPEYADRVLFLVNAYNKNSRLWRVTMHQEDEESMAVTLSCSLMNNCSLEQMVYEIKNIMLSAFEAAREFASNAQKSLADKSNLEKMYVDLAYHSRLVKYQQSLCMGHSDHYSDQEFPRGKVLSIESLIDEARVGYTGALLSLRVICGERIDTITDSAEMLEFNIRTFVKQYPDPHSIESFILELTFEYTTIAITLRKLTYSTPKVLYFNCMISNTTAVNTGVKDDHYFLSVIEVQLERTAEQEYWEAKYLWEDAHDKVENNQQKDLTEEQRWILDIKTSDCDSDIFWGKRFSTSGCYIQSLWHFRRALDEIVTSWGSLDNDGKTVYYRLQQCIAADYYKLGMYEKAYAYISSCMGRAQDENSTVILIDSLCMMRDLRAIEVIDSFRNSLEDVLDHIEEDGGSVDMANRMFAYFDKRSLYMLVLFNRLGEAENLANEMIEANVATEYAQKELKYINVLLGKEKYSRDLKNEME